MILRERIGLTFRIGVGSVPTGVRGDSQPFGSVRRSRSSRARLSAPMVPKMERDRTTMLRRLNETLRGPLRDQDRALQEDLRRLDRELAANALLERRDYSFCLYPEATLRPFVTRVL